MKSVFTYTNVIGDDLVEIKISADDIYMAHQLLEYVVKYPLSFRLTNVKLCTK